MEKMPRLNEEERDNLVAYLDGELEEPAVASIEAKLAVSQVARHDVEMLAQTWEMLDFLEAGGVSPGFTRKTLKLAKLADAPPTELLNATSLWTRRITALSLWVGGLVAAAFGGFAITRYLIPNEGDLLVQELNMVENLHEYVEVDNVEFLRLLQRSGAFSDEVKPAE